MHTGDICFRICCQKKNFTSLKELARVLFMERKNYIINCVCSLWLSGSSESSSTWRTLYSAYVNMWILYFSPNLSILFFPGGTSGKKKKKKTKHLFCQQRRHKRREFNPGIRKIPWRRTWQLTPVFLPGESLGQRSLVGYGPKGHKDSDTTEVT